MISKKIQKRLMLNPKKYYLKSKNILILIFLYYPKLKTRKFQIYLKKLMNLLKMNIQIIFILLYNIIFYIKNIYYILKVLIYVLTKIVFLCLLNIAKINII